MTSSLPTPVASVIVPAHNEGAVIARCLESLLSSARAGEFDVHVVSNGSTDDTVERARDILAHSAARGRWSVEHTDTASKITALRIGDRAASAYPRIYLDADIVLSTEDARSLAATLLRQSGAAVAAPHLRIDDTRSSWPVRAYHTVWTRMPYVADGVIGSGIYAVNECGGRRIGEFPDVVNDDAFVRGLFSESERLTSPGEFVSTAPTTTTALIRRRARWELGNQQVGAMIEGAGKSSTTTSLVRVARRDDVRYAEVAAYVLITVVGKILARYRTARGTQSQWYTDTTSRS